MTYQVIASHRTGSSLLNQYCLNDNDGFGFHEFFLRVHDVNFNWHKRIFAFHSVEEKLEFLEYYKSKDIHFSWKFFPAQVLIDNPELEYRIIKYFQGYKNLTIVRDPWESFLSLSYQSYTDWKTSHNYDGDVYNIDQYEIDLIKIPHLVKTWKMNKDFLSKIDIHHSFEYKDLTINNLQKYFNTSFDPGWKPMGLDYSSKAINLKEAKELFDYEMYGTRNGNNN